MHEATRRRICRAVFLLVCLVPTLGLFAWVGVTRSSPYRTARRRAWQQQLSQQWGLVVTLEQWDTPRRGIVLLDRVRLADPETGDPLLEIRQLEIGRYQGEWFLRAAQPELGGEHILRLWDAFHERFLRAEPSQVRPVQLACGEMTIHRTDGSGATTLSDIRFRLAPSAEGPQATFEFRDVALQMAEPAQLRVTRNRQQSPPATRWELNTRSTALPTSLLADYLPPLRWLGPDATFQGAVEAVRSTNGWKGEFSGRLRDIDLETLVTERYDHKLSGNAEVLFRRARFQDGTLIDAAGDVVCFGGSVSRSLLAQADRTLGLAAAPRVRALEADPLLRYRELKFAFALNQDGLRIVGHGSGPDPGVVMADGYGPLLQDTSEVAQVVALVQALSSPQGVQVPATKEAYQLLHILPLPTRQRDRPPVTARGPFYSPLRMR